MAPEYLSDLFYVYKPFRKNLRSEMTIIQLLILDTTLKNSLPIDLHSCNHLNIFKKNLKTYYLELLLKCKQINLYLF